MQETVEEMWWEDDVLFIRVEGGKVYRLEGGKIINHETEENIRV